MKRNKFIQNVALLFGGLVIDAPLLGNADNQASINKIVQLRVTSKGKGLKNVVVSDGYTVGITNYKGFFNLSIHPNAKAVFISTPAGYAFNTNNGITKQYVLLSEIQNQKRVSFDLYPLNINDEEHQFIIWADPQIKNKNDVKKLLTESVPDVKKYVNSNGAHSLIHGITVGDIVWDEHQLFAEYNKAVQQTGVPFFQCLGNHDMDYNRGDDSTSDKTFTENYGPTYYSFNRGKVHYVVLDNVRYLGKDRQYDGYIQPHQLAWLKKDLAFVKEDWLIILCMHIPVHNGVKNKNELYAILENRKVHIMSGHTHYNVNKVQEGIYEHNHGTVCGAWWTGAICEDGTPCGYGVYSVKGTSLNWHYQAVGKPRDVQMSLSIIDNNSTQYQLVANVWNADTEWRVWVQIDNGTPVFLPSSSGFDPEAYTTFLGPNLPEKRAFAEPVITNHLYKYFLPKEDVAIIVSAKDRFGNIYREERLLSTIKKYQMKY